MGFIKTLLSLAAVGMLSVNANSPPSYSTRPGCGQVNVLFTGLPPYHPLVAAQGFNPAQVDGALRQDAANVVKAGYNLRVTLFGPEKSTDVLANDLKGKTWGAVGVGYGVRGSRLENVTVQFTDIINLYRRKVPYAQFLFNYSPNTTLWALQKYIPLSSDCANSPGQNLGINTYCDICSSPAPPPSS